MSIRKMAQPYACPDDRLAWLHLFATTVLYFGAIALGTVFYGNIPVMVLAVVMFAGGTFRYFGTQHDCGHYSHFTSRKLSTVVGIVTGAFTGHPFYAMKANHNQHHRHIGNLDEREAHEVLTWTVAEYQAASIWGKAFYRTYRSLPVIFFIGPLFIFFIRYRIPKGVSQTGWLDPLMQNVLMFGLWYGVYYFGGWDGAKFLAIALVCASSFGVFMVYAGHNFEDAYWESAGDVDFEEASLRGSSVLDFGPVFHFLSYNFAYHDLHHLQVKIPCYKLQACHIALKEELQPTRMGWGEALGCIKWKLWDEDAKKMVRFSDIKQPVMQPAE